MELATGAMSQMSEVTWAILLITFAGWLTDCQTGWCKVNSYFFNRTFSLFRSDCSPSTLPTLLVTTTHPLPASAQPSHQSLASFHFQSQSTHPTAGTLDYPKKHKYSRPRSGGSPSPWNAIHRSHGQTAKAYQCMFMRSDLKDDGARF